MSHNYSTSDYKVVILAGGTGNRLNPLSLSVPKPVLRLSKYFIEYPLDNLTNAGFYDIDIAVEHLREEISDRIGDGSDFAYNEPVHIKYLKAKRPREIVGTTGFIRTARDQLEGSYKYMIISPGDTISNFDLSELVQFHENRGGIATLALYGVENKEKVVNTLGIVKTDKHGRVTRFEEKVDNEAKVFSLDANSGLYIVDRELVDKIYNNPDLIDFGHDVFNRLLQEGIEFYAMKPRGFGPHGKPYWNDVGKYPSYKATARQELENEGIPGVNPLSRSKKTQRYYPRRNGAKHISIVGMDYKDDSKSLIDRCIVGNGTLLGDKAELQDCIIYTNCEAPDLKGKGLIIGSNVKIDPKAKIGDNVIIGSGSIIKSNAVLHPNITIDPHNTVEGEHRSNIKGSNQLV